MKVIKPLLLFLLITVFSTISAQNSKKSVQKKLMDIKLEINYTQKLIEETKSNRSEVTSLLVLLDKQLRLRNSLVTETKQEVDVFAGKIKKKKVVIAELNDDIKRLRKEYSDLIRYSYKNRQSYNTLMFIFASKDFDQAYKRLKYITNIIEYQRSKSDELKGALKSVSFELDKLEVLNAEKKKLLNSHKSELRNLNSLKGEKQKLLVNLEKDERSLKKKLKKKQNEHKSLTKSLERIIRKERLAARSKGDPRELALMSKEFKKLKGKLPWPVRKGVVVEKFGQHRHLVLKRVVVNRDDIRIAVAKDASVRAIHRGYVAKIQYIPGGNVAVIIKHGDYFTVYGNVVDVLVKEGDYVEVKEMIGSVYSGSSDESSVISLRIMEKSKWVDPLKWLGNRKK
jgi:septal ring factor EnvC (AmiA/AmiB activator)